MKKYVTLMSVIMVMSLNTVFAEEKAAGDLGEVEVTGEAKDKVTIDKITPEINIEVKDIVDSVTDKTETLLEKGKPVPSKEDFDQFNRLGSNQVAKPWLIEFSEPPLITFFPTISETTVKTWKLEVTDAQGNIIKIIQGKGNPVKKIVWNGEDQKGNIIKVGTHYSYRFITTDEFNVQHTTLGKAFILNNLKYQDRKNLYLEIGTEYFFDEERIKAEARELYHRVVDVLREYSKYPLKVEFCTNDPRSELVKKRQIHVSQEIARDMLRLPEDIRYAFPPIGGRGDVLRFVIQLKKI